MKIPDSLKRYGLAKVYDYLDKDPMNNMGKVMDPVNKFAGDTLSLQREAFDKVINDKDSCWHQLIEKVWTQTDPSVLKTIFNNFFVNANLVGWPKQEELRKKYGCNIPWAILLDPTSACNLHCTGCWAAEYGNKLNLTFDEIDSIITQGKELGIYLYIYTGGEPLVRKKDLIALCEKHSDAAFLSFTNATLIDEEFCQDMLRVGNFIPAISLEGFEGGQRLPPRRGCVRQGHPRHGPAEAAPPALRHLRLLHQRQLQGHHQREVLRSDHGSGRLLRVVLPLHARGQRRRPRADAQPRAAGRGLPPHPRHAGDQGHLCHGLPERRRVCGRVHRRRPPLPAHQRQWRRGSLRVHPLLRLQHPGEEPAGVPAIPMFMAYHDNQPFNENMLRPCPMLENPEFIEKMVHETGAHSTDPQSPESVEHLTAKTHPYADNWTPMADKLWSESHPGCAGCAGCGSTGCGQ